MSMKGNSSHKISLSTTVSSWGPTWVNLSVSEGFAIQLYQCYVLLFQTAWLWQPGEAELMLMPQHTGSQKEGKCVWRRAQCVLVWVSLCECVCSRKREGKKTIVLAMLFHFFSHQWASTALFFAFLSPAISLVVVPPPLYSFLLASPHFGPPPPPFSASRSFFYSTLHYSLYSSHLFILIFTSLPLFAHLYFLCCSSYILACNASTLRPHHSTS